MTEREKQWKEFSDAVATHLREYTVPQYGDVGEDLITGYTAKQCVEQAEKYAKRFGTQSREGQQELDFLKIAHYAQCAWEKWNAGENAPQESHIIIMDEERALEGFDFIGSSTSHNGDKLYVYKKRG